MDKIRKGDEVVVITGKDKGKRGTVLRRVDAEHVVVGASIAPRSTSSRILLKAWLAASSTRTCRSISPTWLVPRQWQGGPCRLQDA